MKKRSIHGYRIKELNGKDAERFITALKTSKIRKEAIEKARKCCVKGDCNKKVDKW